MSAMECDLELIQYGREGRIGGGRSSQKKEKKINISVNVRCGNHSKWCQTNARTFWSENLVGKRALFCAQHDCLHITFRLHAEVESKVEGLFSSAMNNDNGDADRVLFFLFCYLFVVRGIFV